MPISKINSKALVDCSVAAVDIADNSITAAKLAGSIANAKLANSSVTINSTSVSLGASANINALDWQSVIVADGSTGTTGVAGRGYFINTTSAAHTFTLPVSATRGDTIAIKDYAGTFATFNLTIGRNGHKIQGVENNSSISTNRASVVLVYADVTRGWEFVTESNVAFLGPSYISATGGTITTSGDFKIHSFTGDGCFVVATLGNPAGGPSNVDYLVVAGGGSGGTRWGGGGGAGGYRTTFPSPGCNAGSFPITITTFPITVGGGGAGLANPTGNNPAPGIGTSGSPSIFSTITSAGGGVGQPQNYTGGSPNLAGGSGGGGQGRGNCISGTGGSGNTPPVSPPQGNPGGSMPLSNTPISGNDDFRGSGGGGASSAGTNGFPGGGAGGAGSSNSISGSPVTYAGGGGGGYGAGPGSPGTGGPAGAGGGGQGGGIPGSPNAAAGSVNTGGGGGGGAYFGADVNQIGGAGGSGIIIIRYKFQ